MEGLQIVKGGKLIETYWHYDEEKDKGSYKTKDVTDQAIRNLYSYCDLEEGVTLKDVFLLLNSELDIFDAVLGNWCKEIVNEGLTKPEKLYDTTDEEAIEFLELYWGLESDKHEGNDETLLGFNFPNFHGIGIERKKDCYFDWNNKDGSKAIMHSKGERTPWAIEYTPTNELINIPVKLKRDAKVYRTDYSKYTMGKEIGEGTWEPGADNNKVVAELDHIQYTLGHILQGIIWELSFSGGPEDRDDKAKEIKKMADDINEEK